jgi:hypothetical protein
MTDETAYVGIDAILKQAQAIADTIRPYRDLENLKSGVPTARSLFDLYVRTALSALPDHEVVGDAGWAKDRSSNVRQMIEAHAAATVMLLATVL